MPFFISVLFVLVLQGDGKCLPCSSFVCERIDSVTACHAFGEFTEKTVVDLFTVVNNCVERVCILGKGVFLPFAAKFAKYRFFLGASR